MSKSYKDNIDRQATCDDAVDNGCYFIMDDHMYRDMLCCSKEGPIMQPSLYIDHGDGLIITRFTEQMPLDYYIKKDGDVAKIDPAEASPYLITVYDTEKGTKTVYEAVEVKKDVPFKKDELADWGYWCDEHGKHSEDDEYCVTD